MITSRFSTYLFPACLLPFSHQIQAVYLKSAASLSIQIPAPNTAR